MNRHLIPVLAAAALVLAAISQPVSSSTEKSGPSPTPIPSVAVMRKTPPKKLLAEFKAAQASEMKVFEARQKAEIRELDASIKSRRKEWEKKERDARHHFFDTHPNGPDRRAYIHDFLQRRQAYVKSLKDEREKRLHDQDVHRQSLRMDQASRLLEFQDKLNMGELPPSSLWPSIAGQ